MSAKRDETHREGKGVSKPENEERPTAETGKAVGHLDTYSEDSKVSVRGNGRHNHHWPSTLV